MVQYQNCAPSGESFDQITGEMDGAVDSIDAVDPGPISFAQSKVFALADESLSVAGICGQSGAMISWSLKDQGGQAVQRGLAECELGSFNVEISADLNGFCDQDLQLSAALGAKAHSEAVIEASCN